MTTDVALSSSIAGFEVLLCLGRDVSINVKYVSALRSIHAVLIIYSSPDQAAACIVFAS